MSFLILAAFAVAAYFLYRHYAEHKLYWKKRGIDGPEPYLLFGNYPQFWSPEKPRSLVLREWSKKYGKVYGIQEGFRNILVVSDFEMLNEIVVKKFDNFRNRVKFVLAYDDGPKVNMIDAKDKHWKRLRALGSAGFSNKALQETFTTVNNSAKLFVTELDKHVGEEVDMLRYFHEYTMDIICKTALGKKDVKMFDNPWLQIVKDIFGREASFPPFVIAAILPGAKHAILGLLDLIGVYIGTPFLVMIEHLRNTIRQRRKEIEAGAPASSDMIDLFIKAEVDDGELEYGASTDFSRKLAFEEIVGLCLIFLLAGFETTANSLSYSAYFLAKHPDVQKKLLEEIDDLFPDGEEVTYDAIADMPYTEAVVKETLRHFPLGSFVVSRECTADTEVCGYKFKKGDLVQSDTWSMHMDKDVWGDDAEEFRPERWLEDTDRPRAAFQAFGEGQRMCLGIRLAMMEEKVALTNLLKNYTIEKNEHMSPLKLVGSFTVGPRNVNVRLQRRK